jgi:hypothetical protein
MNSTRNAGIVYFQDWSVVRYGSPPVIAAAAKGDSAVGGDTGFGPGPMAFDVELVPTGGETELRLRVVRAQQFSRPSR